MTVDNETLQQRLDRAERERQEADARYNEALTALDRSLYTPRDVPAAPPPVDLSRLADLARTADPLAAGAPAIDRSLKGRLRGLIWRIVAPPLETQRQFNAVLVDHLTRNAAAEQARQEAAAATIAICAEQMGALARFQAHLIHYLQTVTAYVDTRDRSAMAGAHVLNAALDAISDNFQKRWESLTTREARFASRVDSLAASVEDLRATAAIAQQTALSLKREVERLIASPGGVDEAPAGRPAPPRAADLDSFKYLGFENEFRGAPEEIRRRLEAYLPLFEGRSDVLDIGCGRGEFLDLLRSRGVTARGIDINAAMVEESRARGLDADQADALEYLRSLPDASLGGVFAAQVIEHLPADYLTTLVEVAAQKIRPGGLVVFETINPTSWVAFFESYIRDLTHVRPLHPETMQYLLRVSGFSRVRVQYSSPVPESAQLAHVPQGTSDAPLPIDAFADTFNRNVDILNGRLFAAQDYAVIGER